MAIAPSRTVQEYRSAVEHAQRAGNVDEACRIAAEAAAAGIEDGWLLAMAVHHHLKNHDFGRAEASARRACALAPNDPVAIGALGLCLAAQQRYPEAISAFDKALAIAPKSAALLYNKGFAQECANMPGQAKKTYQAALLANPNHSQAAGQLAYLHALQGEFAQARDLGRRALAGDPSNPFGAFALSLAEIDAGRPDAVEARLKTLAERPAADVPTRVTAYGILGDALDAMAEYGRAYGYYARKGEILRAAYAGPNAKSQLLRVKQLESYFSRADGTVWRGQAVAPPAPIRTHVFLLGFARSGTTLLENVLATHPEIEVLAERDALMDSYPATDSDAALDAFAALGPEALQEYRDAYWRRAREGGMPLVRPVFVDKLPMNSVVLCLIAKLFPEAKILFALRDPRDVVFSSFRRRFGMTPQMVELATLQGAARYYDAVMSLVAVYRRVLSLDLHEVRLERLVDDFMGEMESLCRFVGVRGTETMKRFEPKHTGRDVTTPSAAQLGKGLNDKGLGQWRNYAPQMAEVMPLLQRWVEAYGYGDGK